MSTRRLFQLSAAEMAWRAAILLVSAAAVLGVTAGQAHASHVSCGDTITADTTLDRDLVNCPVNGLVIGADGITLDLRGHTIDGDGVLVEDCPTGETCDVGVDNNAGHDDVTIKGGAIREFAVAVVVFGTVAVASAGSRHRTTTSSGSSSVAPRTSVDPWTLGSRTVHRSTTVREAPAL